MLAHVLWRSHDAPVLQRLRDPRSVVRMRILFPFESSTWS
jgi:hypothetical protein